MSYKRLSVLLLIPLILIITYAVQDSSSETMPTILDGSEFSVLEYDVVVIGSDPEGIAAAVASSREGAKTLLVDERSRVGGLYTVGMLNMLDLNYVARGSSEILNDGIFLEFYKGIGNNSAFDVADAERVFHRMLADAGVDLLMNTSVDSVIMDAKTIKGLQVKQKNHNLTIHGQRFIDATQDGDIAAAAGAPYTVAREELGLGKEYPAATLVFQLGGINWKEIKEYLNNDGNAHTGANDWAAWGYAEMYGYPSQKENLQMRGLNLGRQKDNSVLVNSLQLFNVDPTSEESRVNAYNDALQELPSIIQYMNDNLVGFSDAYLIATAEELYIRESRHIQGEDKLTAEHVFSGYYDEKTIAFGSYPIDLQSPEKGRYGHALSGTSPYGLTLGMLVPLDIEGMLVVGKASSYDPIAHGSARTVPVGMAAGQAAGIAAAYSITSDNSLRSIANDQTHIDYLKDRLIAQGVNLSPNIDVNYPEKDHWSYPYVQYLRGKGLASRGYANDYLLDDRVTRGRLGSYLILVNDHSALDISYEPVKELPQDVEKDDLLDLINEILEREYTDYQALYEDDIIDELTLVMIQQASNLTNAHLYAVMAGIVHYLLD